MSTPSRCAPSSPTAALLSTLTSARANRKVTPGTPAALGLVTSVEQATCAIRLDWADPMDSTITKYQYRVAPTPP